MKNLNLYLYLACFAFGGVLLAQSQINRGENQQVAVVPQTVAPSPSPSPTPTQKPVEQPVAQGTVESVQQPEQAVVETETRGLTQQQLEAQQAQRDGQYQQPEPTYQEPPVMVQQPTPSYQPVVNRQPKRYSGNYQTYATRPEPRQKQDPGAYIKDLADPVWRVPPNDGRFYPAQYGFPDQTTDRGMYGCRFGVSTASGCTFGVEWQPQKGSNPIHNPDPTRSYLQQKAIVRFFAPLYEQGRNSFEN